MTAQDLKNSVLQLAVQGKLVEQNPADEPAAVLLQKIKAEKARLVKDKKIKADKALPEITEDEMPFDIPESWVWVRLGSIGVWASGATPSRTKSEYYNKGKIPWLKTGDLNDGIITDIPEFITELALKETSVKINSIGSVLIAMYGATIGKVGILAIPATTNQACCACQQYEGIYNKYLFYYLLSQKESFKKQSEGGAQPNISKEKIINYLFVLPPLAEQHRIVEKIEEMLPMIEKYDKAERELTILNNRFPDDLKKSVLQYAVQGKLVEQNPEDEPAAVLLEKIKAEKARLVKEKKIKAEKVSSSIYKGEDGSYYENVGGEIKCIDEEIPFEIPESWCWYRLGDALQVNPRNNIDENLEVAFIPMSLISDAYNNAHKSEIRKWKDIKSGFTHFAEGDIGFAKITPCFENRKSVIFQNLENGFGAGTTELHILRPYANTVNPLYVLWFVKCPMFIDNGTKTYTGTAGQQRIGRDYIEGCLFSLPPLEEQNRIVTKVGELIQFCDRLN